MQHDKAKILQQIPSLKKGLFSTSPTRSVLLGFVGISLFPNIELDDFWVFRGFSVILSVRSPLSGYYLDG